MSTSTSADDYVLANMSDPERAMADALVAIAPTEPPTFVRHEAVNLVRWLREHGWDVTKKPEPPPKRFFCDREHARGIECPEKLCWWNG
jgi:hypothetical protein